MKTSTRNTSRRRRHAAVVSAVFLLVFARPVLSQPIVPGGELPRKSAAPAQERAAPESALYWYDGDQRLSLRIDPSRVADFRPQTAAEQNAAQDNLGRRDEPRVGKLQRPGPLRPARSSEKSLSADGLPAGVSPVLHDASSPADTRALPGGVIVTLKLAPASTDPVAREADARHQLTEAGLDPVRALGPTDQVWLVASPAGLASLALANRLHESGQFVSATPNWWRPRALK